MAFGRWVEVLLCVHWVGGGGIGMEGSRRRVGKQGYVRRLIVWKMSGSSVRFVVSRRGEVTVHSIVVRRCSERDAGVFSRR